MNIVTKEYDWHGVLEQRQQTNFLVLHHAEATTASPEDIDQWHKENGWSGIGYHFYIRKNGMCYTGRPTWAVGAHCQSHNYESMGICFEGNFEAEKPTAEQIKSGIELIRNLRGIYKNVKVVRHKDLNNTQCPGNNFDNTIIMEGMKDMEQQHWAEAIFKELNDRGIKVSEKRFDEPLKRGEALALMLQLLNKIENK